VTPDIDTLEEIAEKSASRRAFLTRGAAGAAVAAAGVAAFTSIEALTASPAFAAINGTFLIAPIRVFDSRVGQSFSGGGTQGLLTRGDGPRQITFGTGSPVLVIIPADAIGAIINLTITGTQTSNGALGITAASAGSAPTASLINWFAPGSNLANASIVPTSLVNTGGGKGSTNLASIKVWSLAGTVGVSKTNFIIDCMGYVAGS